MPIYVKFVIDGFGSDEKNVGVFPIRPPTGKEAIPWPDVGLLGPLERAIHAQLMTQRKFLGLERSSSPKVRKYEPDEQKGHDFHSRPRYGD